MRAYKIGTFVPKKRARPPILYGTWQGAAVSPPDMRRTAKFHPVKVYRFGRLLRAAVRGGESSFAGDFLVRDLVHARLAIGAVSACPYDSKGPRRGEGYGKRPSRERGREEKAFR